MDVAHPNITDESRVELFPLVKRLEDGDYLVGREDLDCFVQLPAVGVETLELLEKQLSVAEVQEILRPRYGDVDIAAFVADVVDLEFVRALDGRVLRGVRPWQAGPGGLFAGLRGAQVAGFFGRPALAIYAAMMLMGAAILAANPRYLPLPDDVFWHPSLAVSQATMFVALCVFASSHELAHLLAAKAVGMGGRIGLGRRLMFVVFQTTLLGAWSVERRQRYLPYLAGMLSDGVRLSLELIFLWLVDAGRLPVDHLWYQLVKALIFGEVMGLLWEFELYMRTDLYYVVGELFHCRNLYEDAWTAVKGWASGLRRRSWSAPLDGVPERERRFVRIYAVFMLGGTLVALFSFAYFSLPLTVGFIVRAWEELGQGPYGLIDGLIVMVVELADLAILAVMLTREALTYFLRRRAQSPPAQPPSAATT